MKVNNCNVLVFFFSCQKISLLDQTSHHHDLFYIFFWLQCEKRIVNNITIVMSVIIIAILFIWPYHSHDSCLTSLVIFILQQAEWITHCLNVIHCLGSHNLPMLAADVCEHTAWFNGKFKHQLHDLQTPLQIVFFQGLLHEEKQDLKWDLISSGRSRHTLISGVNWQT